MMNGTSAPAVGIAAVLLLAGTRAAAQTPASPPSPPAWTFSASGYTYILPDEAN